MNCVRNHNQECRFTGYQRISKQISTTLDRKFNCIQIKVLSPQRLQADISSKQNPLITLIWQQPNPLLSIMQQMCKNRIKIWLQKVFSSTNYSNILSLLQRYRKNFPYKEIIKCKKFRLKSLEFIVNELIQECLIIAVFSISARPILVSKSFEH